MVVVSHNNPPSKWASFLVIVTLLGHVVLSSGETGETCCSREVFFKYPVNASGITTSCYFNCRAAKLTSANDEKISRDTPCSWNFPPPTSRKTNENESEYADEVSRDTEDPSEFLRNAMHINGHFNSLSVEGSLMEWGGPKEDRTFADDCGDTNNKRPSSIGVLMGEQIIRCTQTLFRNSLGGGPICEPSDIQYPSFEVALHYGSRLGVVDVNGWPVAVNVAGIGPGVPSSCADSISYTYDCLDELVPIIAYNSSFRDNITMAHYVGVLDDAVLNFGRAVLDNPSYLNSLGRPVQCLMDLSFGSESKAQGSIRHNHSLDPALNLTDDDTRISSDPGYFGAYSDLRNALLCGRGPAPGITPALCKGAKYRSRFVVPAAYTEKPELMKMKDVDYYSWTCQNMFYTGPLSDSDEGYSREHYEIGLTWNASMVKQGLKRMGVSGRAREISPSSSRERAHLRKAIAVAREFSTFGVSREDRTTWGPLTAIVESRLSIIEKSLLEEARSLSKAYQSDLFDQKKPPAPARDLDLVLAISVLIPELLLIVAYNAKRTDHLDYISFFGGPVSLGLALLLIIKLAKDESDGSLWTSSSIGRRVDYWTAREALDYLSGAQWGTVAICELIIPLSL